jgi:DNA-directed RNA polymerase sigma subunit (sigma70/sigma32)
MGRAVLERSSRLITRSISGRDRSDVQHVEERSMPKDVDSDRYAVTSDSLQAYLRRITTIPLLSREEEVELATRAQAGDQEALDKLIVSNLRYVVSVARRYLGYGLSLADLINEVISV